MRIRPDIGFAGAALQALVIARFSLTALVRMRSLVVIAAVAALSALAARWLRDFNLGATEVRFVVDLGYGATGLGGTLVAILATVQLFHGETGRGSLAFVLSRPVPRAAWLAGLLAGVLALLALLCGGLALLTAGLAEWRAAEIGAGVSGAGILSGGAVLWLRSAVVASLTLWVCAQSRTAFFATGVSLLLVAVAHARPLAGDDATAGGLAGLAAQAARIWPNFGLFEPAGASLPDPGMVAAYGFGYVILFFGAAVLGFQRREC